MGFLISLSSLKWVHLRVQIIGGRMATLRERNGNYSIRFVQTTDAPLSKTGFISVSIAQSPTPQTQKRKITEKIGLLLN